MNMTMIRKMKFINPNFPNKFYLVETNPHGLVYIEEYENSKFKGQFSVWEQESRFFKSLELNGWTQVAISPE